ncbi:MAG: glycosyltransferase family 9 protein [Candidatus Hydrogenedentes bacterium]|nr:glycosyltransferase family 9 protein [Candidatus Hydrogenedentota bacterium]
MATTKSVLCVHPGAVGDVVLSIPAIAALRRRFMCRVTMACTARRGVLVRMAGCADSVIDIDGRGLWRVLAQPCELTQSALDYLAGFDAAVVWSSSPPDAVRSVLQRCGIERVAAAPAVPPSHWSIHASQYYLNTLDVFGVAPTLGELRLDPPENELCWAKTFMPDNSRPAAIIHPGGGSRQKRWPIERFGRVAEWLRETAGIRIVWMAGPAENIDDVRAVKAEGDIFVNDMSLERMAAVIRSGCLYVGNDSGPTHCAAAVGTPTVAMFGPTDPTVWAPVGKHVVVVRGETSCAPCTPETRRSCESARCMDDIPVETVLDAVRAVVPARS